LNEEQEIPPGSDEQEIPPQGGEQEIPPRSEEELRARLEEELKRIRVRDVLLQAVVTLVNLGGQRLGLSEGTEDVRDPEQTRLAIEAVRALLPLLETDPEAAAQVRPVREALAQLQLAYAREFGTSGQPPSQEEPPASGSEAAGEAGRDRPPGQRQGGRLWVPPGSGG
jgi:uncharacterized membrane protein YccC